MRAQKTQNTAAFEARQYAVAGRRYECEWRSMLKRQRLVTFKGTTSKFVVSLQFFISRPNVKASTQTYYHLASYLSF
jgi:hypothetical protein